MTESKRFLLRLDPRLFDVLRRWASDDLRSINAQIEYLLTEQARRAGRLHPHRREPPRLEPPEDDESPIGSPAPLAPVTADCDGTSSRRCAENLPILGA